MIAELDVRIRLAEVLDAHRPLDEFESWLVSESWDMHLDSSPEAQRLVGEIELALSENSSGHLSDDELRQRFSAILSNVFLFLEIDPQHGTVHPLQPKIYQAFSQRNLRLQA